MILPNTDFRCACVKMFNMVTCTFLPMKTWIFWYGLSQSEFNKLQERSSGVVRAYQRSRWYSVYGNAVPIQKYLRERRSHAFPHHYTPACQSYVDGINCIGGQLNFSNSNVVALPLWYIESPCDRRYVIFRPRFAYDKICHTGWHLKIYNRLIQLITKLSDSRWHGTITFTLNR